jgi:hypothetical protein
MSSLSKGHFYVHKSAMAGNHGNSADVRSADSPAWPASNRNPDAGFPAKFSSQA